MKRVIMFLIVVTFYILKRRELVTEGVKSFKKDGKFYFPNTAIGRAMAKKLLQMPGFEFATIFLVFDHGGAVKLERGMPMIFLPIIDPNVAIILVPNLSDDFHTCIDEVEAMITEWTDNHDYVTVPTLQITDVTTKKDAYKASKGDARKGKRSQMMTAINGVMVLYQTACNDDRDNCFEIAASGNFHVRGKGGSVSQIWHLEKSAIAGEILLFAVAVDDQSRTFNWWYSLDGNTWVGMRGTHNAHTKMSGLAPNSYVWFKYELSLNDVPVLQSTVLKIQVPA